MYRCLKRQVVCVITTDGGEIFVGRNDMQYQPKNCPRDVIGCAAGEGYELCREVCGQARHAEVDALEQLKYAQKPFDITKVKVYIYGQDWVCQGCSAALKEAGILEENIQVMGKL